MFRSIAATIATLTVLELPVMAHAHEGHGHTPDQGNTVLHYMTEPYHLLQLVTAVMIVLAIRLLILRWKPNTLHVK